MKLQCTIRAYDIRCDVTQEKINAAILANALGSKLELSGVHEAKVVTVSYSLLLSEGAYKFERDLKKFVRKVNNKEPDEHGNVNIEIPDTQLQSDWNQEDVNAKDYIKNKPNIEELQKQPDWNQKDENAKDFIKNKPNIEELQKQADWEQDDEDAKDFIKNKPTIPSTANDIPFDDEEEYDDGSIGNKVAKLLKESQDIKPITQEQYDAIEDKGFKLYFIADEDGLLFIYYGDTIIARRKDDDETITNVFPLVFPIVFG